jgi:hypothetical protein
LKDHWRPLKERKETVILKLGKLQQQRVYLEETSQEPKMKLKNSRKIWPSKKMFHELIQMKSRIFKKKSKGKIKPYIHLNASSKMLLKMKRRKYRRN